MRVTVPSIETRVVFGGDIGTGGIDGTSGDRDGIWYTVGDNRKFEAVGLGVASETGFERVVATGGGAAGDKG